MTNKETLYNGRTTAEWESYVVDYEKNLVHAEAKAFGHAEDLAKATKKRDLAKMRHFNHMLERAFKSIDQAERHLQEMKDMVETSKRYDQGYGEIQEFLEQMYLNDLEWHRNLKEETAGMTYREIYEHVHQNESVTMLAKMSVEEAQKTFRRDVNFRYAKLVKQIEGKVGAVERFDLERNDNMSLDGYVIGTEGAAKINTIVAGGYNIQRAHYRTLVKAVKAAKA